MINDDEDKLLNIKQVTKKLQFRFSACENLCTLYLCFFGYGMTKGNLYCYCDIDRYLWLQQKIIGRRGRGLDEQNRRKQIRKRQKRDGT